ncbi:TPA: HNH endonuclease, partial [Streptococcus suis]|nr:HNH endonuclease [Streptococcus suis]
IGNLILLTQKLNNEAGDSEYLIKRDTYKKAKNILVEELLEKYPDTFDKEMIKERAKELSEYCYNNIISVDLGL